jgi:hypothetical protein
MEEDRESDRSRQRKDGYRQYRPPHAAGESEIHAECVEAKRSEIHGAISRAREQFVPSVEKTLTACSEW